MSDTTMETAAPALDLPVLYAAVDSLQSALAFHSRDWSRHPGDAWLYGILLGWEEDPTGGDVDQGRAMEELTKRYGWTEEDVERLRTLRAAVRSFTIDAVGDLLRRDAEVRAATLAEVDALILDNDLYLKWSVEYRKVEPDSYSFAPWRQAVARFIRTYLGAPASEDGTGE